MNKYQEAFNNIMHFVGAEKDCAGIFFEYDNEIYDAMDVLQELVDKVTPIKVIKAAPYGTTRASKCPICNKRYSRAHKKEYCPNCGQKFDWEE